MTPDAPPQADTNQDNDAKHLYLIDGSGYIFRAFFGLPSMTRSDGTPVNAVYGFCSMLMGLLEGNEADYLAVVFDTARKNFRNDIYPDYKANRSEPPEDLRPQFGLIREAVGAFDLPALECEGFEADDLIATYARIAAEAGIKVTIVSSDKDLMQLVTDKVDIWEPVKNRVIGPAEVVEKFGVPPEKVIEVQALAGDSSDNVPGVPGIGPKTAAQLIQEYGTLENLLAHAHEIKQPKRRDSLIEFADQARISHKLVTLDVRSPQPMPLEDLKRKPLNRETLADFFTTQEFKRLLVRLAGGGGIAPTNGRDAKMRAQPITPSGDNGLKGADNSPINNDILNAPYGPYETITTTDQLQNWIDKARQQGFVAFDCETTGLDIISDQLVGVSFALAAGKAAYLPLAHKDAHADKGQSDLFGEPSQKPAPDSQAITQLAMDKALPLLKTLLEDPSILKIGQNIKFDMAILAGHNIHITPHDDTMLLSFAQNAGLTAHGMDELSKKHLDHKPISYDSITGKGASRISFDKVPPEKASEYASEDADITLRLWQVLKPKLRRAGKVNFYETIERPLVPVLMQMERNGIMVDTAFLTALGKEFRTQLAKLEAEVHKLAGKAFNLASPQQMAEILYDDLGLPSSEKTGGGARSTAVGALEPLAADYPIVAQILEWRQLAKLTSTYCDALVKAVNPTSKRVHTSFSMTGAQTGRLSSVDPNLQNIPIRTEEGRKIRQAFIAPKGYKLVSLDYSQIELRLLAEIAGLKTMQAAFLADQDIHAATAAEVFGLPLSEVTPELRRQSKAINFGIVYGISAYGLARQIHVTPKEAKSFIDSYFEKFPGIQAYMQETKRLCQLNGYVETIFGRRIHIPAIHDSNKARASGAQRQAINAPIQGAAADVIKRAMIRLPAALSKAGLEKAKLLLQVHDELVFEVPEDQCDALIATARQVMEGAAAPAKTLSIPLKVEAGIGDNWATAH